MTTDLGDLDDKARALVDAGRELDDPQAADRARVRSRLAAALGTSTALTAATKAGAAAAKSGGLWATGSALGAKLLSPALVAVALSAAAGAVVWTQSSSSPTRHPSPSIKPAARQMNPTPTRAPAVTRPLSPADAVTDTDVAAPPATTASPNPGSAPLLARPSTLRAENARQVPTRRSRAVGAPISPATLASPSEARVETAASGAPTQEAETRARVEPPQPTPASSAAARPLEESAAQPASNAQRSTQAQASSQPEVPPRAAAVHAPALTGELRLLGAAQRALSNKQFARALALLDEHASRYPTGSLLPERLAARAVVLCRMDRNSAGLSELRLLEAGAPASPLLHWARTNCSSRRSR